MKDDGHVYILSNQKMGALYIGSTSDLLHRILEHKNKTYKGFTAKYNIDKLVYYEWFDSLEEMVKVERRLKEWPRNWKLKIIIDFNPEWHDLTNDILRAYNIQTFD